VTLGPYQLRSFGLAPEVEVAGFNATPAAILFSPEDSAGRRNDAERTYGNGFAIVGGTARVVTFGISGWKRGEEKIRFVVSSQDTKPQERNTESAFSLSRRLPH
jgi:hypothetical protein